jgi:ribokinase
MVVTIIGDAFIDIAVPVYGIKPGETYYRNIAVSCGGTANVAIQVSRLGEKTGFVGNVGNDALGLYFVENLKKHNIKVFTSFDDNHSTGLCVSLVYGDGERTLIAKRGANDYLNKGELESRLREILKSKIVYLSGYSLLHNSEAILELIKECQGNCEIWFNPGAPNIITSQFRKVVNDFVDVLILNLDEARTMTKKDTIEDIMAKLQGLVNLSVVSIGKDGCIVTKDKGWVQVPANESISSIDTTGAGDAFSAGLIIGRLRGMDGVGCAKLANQVAINFLQQKGESGL